MQARYAALLVLTGCAIDYNVSKEERNPGIGDTALAPEPDGEPEPEPEPEPDDTAAPTEGPVADCVVSPNPVQPPFEAATWDGRGSYSTDSTIETYTWLLESKPTGSATTMPGGNSARRGDFIPDLAGEYVGRLTVTDANGLSDSCTAILDAVPIENLWIEMYWSEPSDDMDLHLLRNNASLESRNDCYFMNCVGSPLEWGDSGSDDNPILDLDDIYGVGPENINITEPSSGIYTIVVHDYVGSTYPDFTGQNRVTVNVYIDGTLKWTDTRRISGNGSYVSFAEISWPDGAITSL
jgi:hypothetical protein